jgi:hypothetical protein
MPLILWLIARSASNSKFKVDTAIRSFLVAAALSLAWCLWQRVRREIWTHRRLLATSGVVFSLLLGFTTIAFLNTGFPSRLPDYLLPAEIARKTGTPRDECFRNSNSVKKATETYCSFGSEEGPETPSAIVWGDSFANQYLDPISAAALADGIHGLIATQSGCAAFIDDPAKETGYQQPCRDFNRGTLDFVLGHQEPRIVVLGSDWGDALDVSALVIGCAPRTRSLF